jgi:hypothetical protein
MAELSVEYESLANATPAMKAAVTTEANQQSANHNSSLSTDQFSALCQSVGVSPSDNLRHAFNKGVDPQRMKANRGIVLCKVQGVCWRAAEARSGKACKQQPHKHDESCMYFMYSKLWDAMVVQRRSTLKK